MPKRVPKTRTAPGVVPFQVWMPRELRKRAKHVALDRDVTLSEFMVELLERATKHLTERVPVSNGD